VFWLDINSKRYGRIYESTHASAEQRELAEQFYHQRLAEAYREKHLGIPRRRLFKEAAAEHLKEVRDRPMTYRVATWALDRALPYIGEVQLDQLHDGHEKMKQLRTSMALAGNKEKTVNLVMQRIRHVLLQCARKYRDDNGQPWLATAPMISMRKPRDARPPYPLSWDEERKLLLPLTPPHIADPVQYIINAGPRSRSELCKMRWDWERRLPELDTPDFKVSVFVLPTTKNGEERVIVQNRVAQQIVERQRGKHPEYVWTFEGRPLVDLHGSAWPRARAEAVKCYQEVLGRECPEGFKTLHIHDFRHTFGRRLRAAGVSRETRAALLGHSNGGDMTTHYSAAELLELIEAVRKIEVPLGSAPTLSVIRAQAA
jgi:integrase